MDFHSPLTPAQLARRLELLARTGIAAGVQIRLSPTASWSVTGDRCALVAAPTAQQRRAQLTVRGQFAPRDGGCDVRLQIRPPGAHYVVLGLILLTAGGLCTWGLWPISPVAGPILTAVLGLCLAMGYGLDFYFSRKELAQALQRALAAPATADVREQATE